MLTQEERVRIVKLHARFGSIVKVQRYWNSNFSHIVPTDKTILSIVRKFGVMGSVLDARRSGWARSMLTGGRETE